MSSPLLQVLLSKPQGNLLKTRTNIYRAMNVIFFIQFYIQNREFLLKKIYFTKYFHYKYNKCYKNVIQSLIPSPLKPQFYTSQ